MTFIGFIVCAVLIGLNIFVDYRSSDAGKRKKTFRERYQYEEDHGLVHSHYADGTPDASPSGYDGEASADVRALRGEIRKRSEMA